MTYVMVDYHGHTQELLDADDAIEWFDEQSGAILGTGRSGQTIWFGPSHASPEMRVDIDIDVDRAALTWLADGGFAIQPSTGEPITVLTSADGRQDVINGDRACLDVVTTRDAVREYVSTGARPSNLTWTTGQGAPQ